MITNHLVNNHPRSQWELIKGSGDFASMKAKSIAQGTSTKVVGIVFGDDEKAANPSCMTFDEFILKNTKTLKRHTVVVCRMKPLGHLLSVRRALAPTSC